MGCFLACFGFHKRRKKRRPPADRVIVGDRIHLSYEPLDSSRLTTCDTSKQLEIQDAEPRDRAKEQPWIKIKKKVSFNLNIQTYEPIPDYQYFLESDEEVKHEKQNQNATNGSVSSSHSGCYPQNHRYQNCRDSTDDEEDDFAYDESDLDDNATDEDHDEGNDDELKPWESESNIIDRSQHVHSVLKPVENLTQWRTAKAKAVTITKQQLENKTKTSEQPQSPVTFSSNPSLTHSPIRSRTNSHSPDPRKENLVNTSLSDWLV